MNSSHRWGGMTLAEWRTGGSLNLHPTLPRVKSVRQERVLQLWPLAHHQVLLVHQGAANEVAENKNQPLGQTAGVSDNQSLATARWISNHPVQLMELNLYMDSIMNVLNPGSPWLGCTSVAWSTRGAQELAVCANLPHLCI